ncbi:MAG: hypothetical protein E7329_00185 [Clostridiales bacterium]|nr:hypothetical protein [Clostridiales bacterium]
MKKYGSALAFGILAGAMVVFPREAAAAALQGLMLFAQSVLPVLGPFMVCMLMLSSRLGGSPPWAAALSWLSGSPGGARMMQLYSLRGKTALRYAAITGTMSPMFFLGTVEQWLGNAGGGWLIFLSHVLGAIASGLCFRGKKEKAEAHPVPTPFFQALRDAAQALLTVALCMMLGCTAAKMAACALPGLSPVWAAALQCGLEVTAGTQALIALHLPHTPALVCAACSFGGLSLLLQNAAFWQESGVGMGKLLLVRLLHGIFSFFVCLLLGG